MVHGILKDTKHNVPEIDLLPCSGEGVGGTYSFGSVKELNSVTGSSHVAEVYE
jgi:hypothetical protein